jgi:DNA-directed RNA polymerase subunit beta'
LARVREVIKTAKLLEVEPDRKVDFNAILIKIASSETIRKWSFGEVKKPETINYRTFRPEKDGLFCEKIFGPTKDWECYCGKYKRIKYREIICDRCGVQVTTSKVRRERMGHIELSSPVAHIWFLKSIPSRIGVLLDMSIKDLERVIYYESYIVTDSGSTTLAKRQLLTEEDLQKCKQTFGTSAFKYKIGAEAIKELLKEIDVEEISKKLKVEVKSTNSIPKKKELIKKLKIVENFRRSSNKPDWMIIDILPVIPPDLRPLVPLDGSRFASSDLNDLYRRVINRNNRLKRLVEAKAPDIIIHNEKRMLQEAVDALFDNGRRGTVVRGSRNKPLKSLSDMLKGKQGRFRQNLLGKRVDYSGRSVIVVGPELKFYQCGIPKKMLLELFKPFIIKKLEDRGYVHTVKSARKMVEDVKPEVWEILEEVIKEHPVLLNRAPTLHRQGIQAFEAVPMEGSAIRIHPLVCTAFNADFDGDQMAVHVPLSPEAIIEARTLIFSTNNIFSTSNSHPLASPAREIVAGCSYLTKDRKNVSGEGMIFSDFEEVILAYELGKIALHAKIKVRIEQKELLETTVGRVIFNSVLPKGSKYINKEVAKRELSGIVTDCYKKFGNSDTVVTLDRLKDLGFRFATKSGLTIGIDDMKVPPEKGELIKTAKIEVEKIHTQYRKGIITNVERYNKVIDVWISTSDKVAEKMREGMKKDRDGFNPIYMMVESGSRGTPSQVRQLAAMRGVMQKPTQKVSGEVGEFIEQPIIANFREGLTVLEYFISTHGSRKGIADTALKTANAGYLTRRLVDVAQDVIITEDDCKTIRGVTVGAIKEGSDILEPLRDRLVGRVAVDNVVDILTDELLVKANEVIDEEKSVKIEKAGIEKIRIRSVLTCETRWGVCAKCYGWNLGYRRLAEIGEAVGIIAAQSIGEPGTQLTLRTFHIGGTASRTIEQPIIETKNGGKVSYHNIKFLNTKDGKMLILNRQSEVSIFNDVSKTKEVYEIPYASEVFFKEGESAKKGAVIAKWDMYNTPIFCEKHGRIEYKDIIDDVTIKEETDKVTNIQKKIVIPHKEDKLHPRINILDDKKNVISTHSIPIGANLNIPDGEMVEAGAILAKIPRDLGKTGDITGGLPRVSELFEARKPKDCATITEIDGNVVFGGIEKRLRKIIVKNEGGIEKEYLVPQGKHLTVSDSEKVIAGDSLTVGSINPHDILRVKGENAAQEYLLEKIQEVYRVQDVMVNDKHIEIIVRQMLRKVRIEDPGNTSFLVGQEVDKFMFREENAMVIKKKGKPATARPLLLGVTKASLSTESFFAAASFQETTRVLTEAATVGKTDVLKGLKENIIIGRLIPAGTGIYRNIEISSEETEKKEEE